MNLNILECFSKLAGKTLFITGASRGIGKAIALKAAADGANIVIAAKTAEPHVRKQIRNSYFVINLILLRIFFL